MHDPEWKIAAEVCRRLQRTVSNLMHVWTVDRDRLHTHTLATSDSAAMAISDFELQQPSNCGELAAIFSLGDDFVHSSRDVVASPSVSSVMPGFFLWSSTFCVTSLTLAT